MSVSSTQFSMKRSASEQWVRRVAKNSVQLALSLVSAPIECHYEQSNTISELKGALAEE